MLNRPARGPWLLWSSNLNSIRLVFFSRKCGEIAQLIRDQEIVGIQWSVTKSWSYLASTSRIEIGPLSGFVHKCAETAQQIGGQEWASRLIKELFVFPALHNQTLVWGTGALPCDDPGALGACGTQVPRFHPRNILLLGYSRLKIHNAPVVKL